MIQKPSVSEKIQKVLARAGVASRRTAEEWIAEGRVMLNGQTAQIGDRVTASDEIYVDGKHIPFELGEESSRRLLMYHKPEGQVCTRTDPEGRPTVFEHLPELDNERWVAVGRLDLNSVGLLLFTTDGDFANSLMHPSSQVEREYAVRVLGPITQDMIQQLLKGVMLDDGIAQFSRITQGAGEGANQWFRVTIKEGKKREVRRMWEAVGGKVNRLIRIRFGHLELPRDLPPGSYRELDQEDIDQLANLVGVTLKRRTGLYGRQKVRPEPENPRPAKRGFLRRR